MLDLEQADFSAAHLREVLQQRHDLCLRTKSSRSRSPGTALSSQLDLALDDRVRVSSGSPSRTGMLVMRPKLMSRINLDESPLRWGEVCLLTVPLPVSLFGSSGTPGGQPCAD